MAIKILIADSSPAIREQIRADLTSSKEIEIAGLARDGHEALQLAHKLRPDIALLATDLAGYNGFQIAEFMAETESNTVLTILVTPTDSPELLRRAMRSGARDIIVYPTSRDKLLHTIHEVFGEMQNRQSSTFVEAADPAKSARVVAVGGAKGGIGKTTITTNLAVSLALETGEPIVLFDLYTQFGDIALLLNMTPKRTLMDLSRMSPDTLDAQILEDCMERHESGMRVLVTSPTPVALDALNIPLLDRIIRLLKDNYRYILIDVPPILHAGTLHAFTYATTVMLIANRYEITAINDTRQLLDTLEGKYVARDNLNVILNRLAVDDDIKLEDVERILGFRVAGSIPNDGTVVPDSINDGVPFMISHPDSEVAKSIRKLAHMIAGITNVEEEEKVTEQATPRWGKLLSGLLGRVYEPKRSRAA